MFSIDRLIAAASGAPPLSLRGERLHLRPAERRDHVAWSSLRRAARAALQPWEPRWAGDHLSERSFRRRVAWSDREILNDRAYPFLIFEATDGGKTLVGGLTLENVRRGAAQSASLGYWLAPPFQGRGLMTEALGLVITFAASDLGLSRLEAACLPENDRSRRLLERCGFAEEALLRGYLQINGVWRDHILYERRSEARRAAHFAPGFAPAHAEPLSDLGPDPKVARHAPGLEPGSDAPAHGRALRRS